MTYQYQWKSPLGTLDLFMQQDALTGLYFEDHVPVPRICSGVRDARAFATVIRQLEQYFAGERTTFDVPIALQGTPFQRDVWSCLTQIPCGQTTNYATIAARLNRSGAARAVGGAVSRNPVSIIVPCHRVVGAGGKLTGFAGGIERKTKLLQLEGICIFDVIDGQYSEVSVEAA